MQLFILLKRALLELRDLCSVCHLSGRQPAEFSGEEKENRLQLKCGARGAQFGL